MRGDRIGEYSCDGSHGLSRESLLLVADLRAGRWGADLLAVLALGGTVAVGEFLAGAIIAVVVDDGHWQGAGDRGAAARGARPLRAARRGAQPGTRPR